MTHDTHENCGCDTKYCPHYESDFDRFVKDNPMKASEVFEGENSRLRKTFDEAVRNDTTQGMRERFDQLMALFDKEGWGLGTNQKRVLFEKLQSEAAFAVSEMERNSKVFHGNAKICEICLRPIHIHPHDFYDNSLDCNCETISAIGGERA